MSIWGRDYSVFIAAAQRQSAIAVEFDFIDPITRPDGIDELWYEERPSVMDERPCDHEEIGVQVWKVAEG